MKVLQTLLMFTKSLTKMELKKKNFNSFLQVMQTCITSSFPAQSNNFLHKDELCESLRNFLKREEEPQWWRALGDEVQQQVHSHTISPVERQEQLPASSWRCPAGNCKLTCEMGTIYFTAGLIPHSAYTGVFISLAVSGNVKACKTY